MGDKYRDLDAFWDLSSLVPKKNRQISQTYVKEPSRVIDIGSDKRTEEPQKESDTVIVRYISPDSESERLKGKTGLTHVFSYAPEESLIHNVSVEKWSSSYNYYGTFLKNAIEYNEIVGRECAYAPFFSYVPQYDQLNKGQLEYYFWFRENIRAGKYIDTDISYLLLYIYELLNLGERLDTRWVQYILTELWNEYHDRFPAVSSKLSAWICDYSLLHRLPAPENARREMIQSMAVLKEFYIKLPDGDYLGCSRSLIKYCSSYDFRTSKFFNEQSRGLFEKMIVGALGEAVRFYSRDGKMLSELTFGDSRVERDVYAGAVCVSDEKYKIKVEYCSFSRANELRFLVGDIIKYCENKLRAYMGIKSRLTVYSVPVELRAVLDKHFELNMPHEKPIRKRREEKHEYDALYDLPQKKLSLSDAATIELSSWETTRELVDAFDGAPEEIAQEAVLSASELDFATSAVIDAPGGLDAYRALLKRLAAGQAGAVAEYARGLGKMPDAVADEINEAAFDEIGDAVIEDDGNGGYAIIEDYRYLFE